MIINPIIPIWVMGLICVAFVVIAIKDDKNKFSILRKIIIIALLFVINLRFMIVSPGAKITNNNLDVLFVIDTTISMLAEDYNGNKQRLEAVKKDCSHIIEELSGAKFSVIIFNNDSQILIPYTKDSSSVGEAIESIQVMEEFYAQGSSLNIPMEDMLYLLESSNKKQDRKRVLFFISDGEITNEEPLQSFEKCQPYVDGGAVLGYGTTQGGTMQTTDKYTNKIAYLEDDTAYPRRKALSILDETNLKTISQEIGIDYIHMDKQSKVNNKLKEIKQKLMKDTDGETKDSYTDIYYFFVIPLAGLLLYELINYKRRLLI